MHKMQLHMQFTARTKQEKGCLCGQQRNEAKRQTAAECRRQQSRQQLAVILEQQTTDKHCSEQQGDAGRQEGGTGGASNSGIQPGQHEDDAPILSLGHNHAQMLRAVIVWQCDMHACNGIRKRLSKLQARIQEDCGRSVGQCFGKLFGLYQYSAGQVS